MDETVEMLIALINGNSNLMIIKTYQVCCEENIFTFKSHIKLILHTLSVTHFTIRKSKTFKRDLSHVYKCNYWGY